MKLVFIFSFFSKEKPHLFKLIGNNSTNDFEKLGFYCVKSSCLDKIHLFNQLTCLPF